MSDELPPLHPEGSVIKPILIPVTADVDRRTLYGAIAKMTGYPNRSAWMRAMCDKAVREALKHRGGVVPRIRQLDAQLNVVAAKRRVDAKVNESKEFTQARLRAQAIDKANELKQKRAKGIL